MINWFPVCFFIIACQFWKGLWLVCFVIIFHSGNYCIKCVCPNNGNFLFHANKWEWENIKIVQYHPSVTVSRLANPYIVFLSARTNGVSLSCLNCSMVREMLVVAGDGELSTLRTGRVPVGCTLLAVWHYSCYLYPSSERDCSGPQTFPAEDPVVGGHSEKLLGVSTWEVTDWPVRQDAPAGLWGSQTEEVDPAADLFKPWFRLLFKNKSQAWTLFILKAFLQYSLSEMAWCLICLFSLALTSQNFKVAPVLALLY